MSLKRRILRQRSRDTLAGCLLAATLIAGCGDDTSSGPIMVGEHDGPEVSDGRGPSADPDQPGEGDPDNPAGPGDPDWNDPSDPDWNDPSDPGEPDTNDPDNQDPNDPDNQDPSDPDNQDPSDPDNQDPNDPDTQDPSDPNGPDIDTTPGGDGDPDADIRFGGADCLEIDNPTGAGLRICGEWSFDRETQSFRSNGDLVLETPVGDIDLLDADLLARRNPVELVGSAKVPFPAIGFLEDAGVEGEAPEATIALAHGNTLGAIEINGIDMETDPNHYYLLLEYSTGMSVSFGGMGISTPGAGSTLAIAPEEPLIYVGGDIAGMLTGGLVDDAAIGFSLAGRIPYETANELYDGDTWETKAVRGHLFLQGGVQVGSYPVHLSAAAVIDADADDDGTTVFEGDGNDVALAADGAVSLGYSKAGFDLTLEVGDASLLYDGSVGPVGELYVYAESGLNPFEGTLLEDFNWTTGHTLYGYWQDTDDFVVGLGTSNARVGPFTLREMNVELHNDGVGVDGELGVLPFDILGRQAVEFEGEVYADGQFQMTGVADMTVASFTLADAQLTFSNAGLAGEGRMSLPGLGQANMAGQVMANGDASLRGNADLSPLGFTIADAAVSLSQAGASVSGQVDLPGLGNASISGEADASGAFSMSGQASIRPAGFDVANAVCSLDNNGADVSGRVSLPGLGNADVSGAAQSNGQFSMSGRGDLSPLGFPMAGAGVTVHPRGADVSGRVGLPAVGHADVSGAAQSNGQFNMSGAAELAPAGFRLANGRATVAHNGASISGRAGLPGLGNVNVSGAVQSNGQFHLTGRGDLSPAGLRIANASVTINPNGASISGRSSFAGNGVNLSGSAQANGRFSVSGRFDVNLAAIRGYVRVTASDRGASGAFHGRACVPYTEQVCSRVCDWAPWPVNELCDMVCDTVSRTSCVDLGGASVSTSGRVCADFPAVGRQCVNL